MSTLDDKILGEKTHYYCSSSEGEEGSDEEESSKSSEASCRDAKPKFIPSSELSEWEGSSTNTGPKGVIKDWQRYKQLESEKREEQERERIALMKKLSLTCQSHKDEEEAKKREEELESQIKSLLDDKILEEFKKKRMEEMMARATKQPRFGTCLKLKSGQEFLDAVDKEKSVNVIIYIYRDGDKLCQTMYNCLQELARDYPQVKFCSMEVTLAGMSKHFKESGVPALLVYKDGCLIGNFVRLTDEFGDYFVAGDIENYLLEHGLLPDSSSVLSSMRSKAEEDLSD